MRRRPAQYAALLAVAAAAAASLSLAPAASAASGITVVSVTVAPGTGNLAVTTDSPTPITSLSVQLQGTGGGASLTVTDFDLSTAAAGQQTFTLTTPLTSTNPSDTAHYLPLGNYDATVDATDSGGDPDPVADGGVVSLEWSATLTGSATPSSVAYDNNTVNFSGLLTGTEPGGSPGPISGMPVTLVDTADNSSEPLGTTAADGTYQATAQASVHTYVVQAGGTANVEAAQSPDITIGANPNKTEISATITPANPSYGQTATMTGTALYQSSSTSAWVPLASSPVDVGIGTTTTTVTTGTDGTFSWQLPANASGAWTATAGASSPLLKSSEASGTVTVAAPLQVRWFTAKLHPLGYVAVSGCVQVTAPGFKPPAGTSKIQIQYARSAAGPWTYLSRVSLTGPNKSSCAGAQESYFTGKPGAKLARAYYRARFVATPTFQGAVSKAVLTWLNTTKITAVKVTPSHPRTGTTATITGRLWRHGTAWHPYGHRKVEIVYRFKGDTTWHTLASTRTAATGRFSLHFTDDASATLSAIYRGDATHLWSQGAKVYVPVHSNATGPLSASRLAWLARSLGRAQLTSAPGRS